jgi:hypothetical protein
VYLFVNFSLRGIRRNTEVCEVPHRKYVKHIQLVYFLRLCAEQTPHFFGAVPFFFHMVNVNHFMNIQIILQRSAGSVTGGLWRDGGVDAVDIEARNSSSALSFSFSLSAGSVIFCTQSSMKSLKSIVLPPLLWFVVYFFNSIKLFMAAICCKNNTDFLVHFTACMQHV